MTDEQIASIQYAANWLSRSEDIGNRKHAERLRALLAAGASEGQEPVAWITLGTKDGKRKLEEGCTATNPEYVKAHKEWLWEPLVRASSAHPSAEIAALRERIAGMEKEAREMIAKWIFDAVKTNLDAIHSLCMEFGCQQGDTVGDWLRDRLTAVHIDRFECAARKQGTAGGNDAADCDWPGCGCDPKANRVFESLEEGGLFEEAARYRWARSPENGNAMYVWISEGNAGGNLDKLIDAAIAKEKQG